MLKLIIGVKGTGKTKALIDMVKNPSAENQAIMDELAKLIVDRRKNKNLDVK